MRIQTLLRSSAPPAEALHHGDNHPEFTSAWETAGPSGDDNAHTHTLAQSHLQHDTQHISFCLYKQTLMQRTEKEKCWLKPSNMHADKKLVHIIKNWFPQVRMYFCWFFYLLHEILAIQHPSRPEEWSTMTQNIDRSVRAAQHVNFWLEQHQCVPVVFWLSSLSPSWCFAGSLSWYSMLHVRN